MEIIHQQVGFSEYISLIESKYSKQKNYTFFLEDTKKSLAFSVAYQKPHFIMIKDGDKIVGHCALLLDAGLPKGEAFFGFFDVIDDAAALQKLWFALVDLAKSKEVSILKGPVNATIWHQYRALRSTNGSDFFKTELFSGHGYYDFLKSMNPVNEILYHSGYRENFTFIIDVTEPAYKKALEEGYVIEELETIVPADLIAVLEISKIVFKESWGYTALPPEGFATLYSSDKLTNHLNNVYLLKKEGRIIGYITTLVEDENTLILKTIAVSPEFQGLGLGNTLLHRAHKDAVKKGYKKIIYALIRKDNNVKNFPKNDAVVFREYSAFEFNIQ